MSDEKNKVNEEAEKLNKERKSAEDNLRKWQDDVDKRTASIERMKKANAEKKKKIREMREKVRTHALILLGVNLVAAFGYQDKEKECLTPEEYTGMSNEIITKAKNLLSVRSEQKRFSYEDLFIGLELTEKEKAMDNETLQKIVWGKVKKMIEEYVAERKNEQ